MVFARNAAMGFNRYLDREFDAANPRTSNREIPAGVIKPGSALLFVVINCLLFIVTTWFINTACFYLSPVALLIVLGYSYTKRFTWLCHVVLGTGLALAPVGAYLAVTGYFDWIPVLYGGAVLLWTAGFDVIYALQDEDFDKSLQLYSMPAFFGKVQALRLSEIMHAGSAALMITAGFMLHRQIPAAGLLAWIGTALFLGFLVYQHLLVKPNDLSKVNLAFATTNGLASITFSVLTILDLLI
jgi:4-hydroxybenzoate polyprenyltransferase